MLSASSTCFVVAWRIATRLLVLAGLEHVLAPLVMEVETERNAQLQHQAPP